MSNIFKLLDNYFPCGRENRPFGEVVSIDLHVFDNQMATTTAYVKRKAWYVNASVNAWHLHRALCRELKGSGMFPAGLTRSVKDALITVVMYSYLRNYTGDRQYFEFVLHTRYTGTFIDLTQIDGVSCGQEGLRVSDFSVLAMILAADEKKGR